MDFDQLKAFYTLAQTRNFTRTAEILHLVQSTVTMRIKQLEERVGKPLFIRDKRNVEITQAGMALLPYAERIIKLAQAGIQEVAALQPYEDRLAIGGVASLWSYVLEPILKEYHLRYPTIAVRTKTGHSSDINTLLHDQIVQIGMVYTPPSLSNYEVIPFFEDEILLVGSPDHPISKEGEIDINDLEKIPLLLVNWGSPFTEWIAKMLPASYVPRLQVDNSQLAIDLVLEGLGVSLFTRSMAKKGLADGTLKEIKISGSVPPKRPAYIVLPKEKKNRSSVEKWLSLMEEFGYSF
ncbi:LysR family transcriptional regulator [Brevibacillus daliensis]|uniref:LysR family transcriptional regulator n=1 Tax=Brevibacillus daliensis TaxID=2892995 RepID=UPI001E3F30CE|nr:LysR family transcriptional regulator [Brevibacillus daliensis]